MRQMIELNRAGAAHDPVDTAAAQEPLRRKCAYAEAVGACLLLMALAVTLV